ncbi:MAG: AAA family ATPase [Bacteroidales bacterium]
MITNDFKLRIIEAIKRYRNNYASAAKMATALGISSAQLSRILNGDLDNVLSDSNWISIARKLDVVFNAQQEWKTAKTPTFSAITAQLTACKNNSLSGLLCDMADLGKTYAAKCFCRENKFSIYIDCSQVKSRQKLIRQIAKELGLGSTSRYADVYADLVFYLRSIPNPLIILDEAGDLDYPAFLELKALWNATENCCGWYMMGADGLKAKIESNLGRKRVGYAEIFSRFGSRYQKISPDGKEALQEFTNTQIVMIAKANATESDLDIKKLIAKTGGSLRRVRTELNKTK